MRRRIALAAVTTLASTAVLAGAQLASAEASPGSTSPSPSASASASVSASASASADKADKAGSADDSKPDASAPQLQVKGLPDKVEAGGTAEFTVQLTNKTASNVFYYPLVEISNGTKNPNGVLTNSGFGLDFRRPKDTAWEHTGIPQNIPDFLNNVRLLGTVDDQGNFGDDALHFLQSGKSVSFRMRLTLPDDAPLGEAQATFLALWAPASDGDQPPTVAEDFAYSDASYFCIVKPKPHPTGSPSPTGSSPAPSPSSSKSGSSAPVSTPTPTGTPTTFPVTPPKPVAVPIAPGAAKAAAAAPDTDAKSLAFTGGGSDATPIALGGAAAVALGVGTLVALRRRRSGGSHA
ncbi:hypothetical protein P3T36_002002 [Kitasatospora sp. MAP12-15]|uniref:hypothetical protein n=1 Tax=unclassified Kitasatospora TaxID=2633591 RepID=UPI00247306A6|nr:hypothetical protein [Kitasatospora sp. MAP12-44]MDH6111687.1 hypothetical protein [Kitasatospora sp. MAP12-44]